MMDENSSKSKEGIDIRLALEILSQRSPEGNPYQRPCECIHHAPPMAKNMGQVIDISGDSSTRDESSSSVVQSEGTSQQSQKQGMEVERAERRRAIEEGFRSMTVKELLSTVLQAQEERVATYRVYDRYVCAAACCQYKSLSETKRTDDTACHRPSFILRGLDEVLETGNMTNYPHICAEATASFAVLSDTINVIQTILADRRRMDAKQLIHALQMHEKEKLNLTAALHLERIREQNENLPAAGGDGRIASLLQEGVRSLQTKISSIVGEINGDLEEIRCAMMEEE